MNNLFGDSNTCLVCGLDYHCGCQSKWTVKSIEDTNSVYLQDVVRDACAEPLPEENRMVMAMAMELLHRTRYHIDPEKRFTGDVSK